MEMQEIKDRFRSHAVGDESADLMNEVRQGAQRLAADLNMALDDGREKALALTKLEEFVFWANAGIARGDESAALSA